MRPKFKHQTPVDLTKYGSHVYVLVRRGELRASKIMAKRLMNHPKIVHLPLFSYLLTTYHFSYTSTDSPLEHRRNRMPRRRRPTQQPPH
jgi:hypothetical protein